MPSRDIRRAQRKKGASVSDSIEKRKTTHPAMYVGLVALLVVIVVTFVLAGPGGPLTRGAGGSSGAIVFGSYEGHEIAYTQGSYFAQIRDQIANQAASSSTSQDPLTTAQSVWYQAFLSSAERIAMLLQAERAGVAVTEDAIDTQLLTYPAYLDDNGKFSEAKYQAATTLEKANTRQLVRDNMVSGIFVSDVLSGVKDGSKETDFVKAMATPERSFRFVSWPFSGFPSDEVRKYAEANKSRFVRIKLSRILIKSSESQAVEIRRKILDKTSTFEELAKTYSKDTYADKGGDMGWRYAYDLEADFDAKETAQKVLNLKAGEVSDVLKGTFGWMIYRCDSEAVDANFADAATEQDVRTYLNTYEKGKIEDYFSTQATQLSRRAGEVGFDNAVREMGLKAVSTDYFPINLSGIFSFAPVQAVPSTETPTNAASSEDFFFRAFSLGKNQASAPIVLDDRVLVLELSGERNLPDSTASLIGSYVTYIASQSVQSDLAQTLLTPDKLTDNFAAAFNTYVAPSIAKQ